MQGVAPYSQSSFFCVLAMCLLTFAWAHASL